MSRNVSVCLCVCVLRLNGECCELIAQRDVLVRCLERQSDTEQYLNNVVDVAAEFHEVREIIARYCTLVSTQQVSL